MARIQERDRCVERETNKRLLGVVRGVLITQWHFNRYYNFNVFAHLYLLKPYFSCFRKLNCGKKRSRIYKMKSANCKRIAKNWSSYWNRIVLNAR